MPIACRNKLEHGTEFCRTDCPARTPGVFSYVRVERAEDLPAAIDRALARRPALLDVVVTPEAMSSDGQSGLAWVPDLQPLAAWDDAERRWRQEPAGEA